MERSKENCHCLSGNLLKLIAIACMLCDHMGYILFYDNGIMRGIGRLAFPVFAFLLAEGYRHTSDIKKYLLRLSVFAVLSEIPFDLCMTGKVLEPGRQNVFFTLTLGLGMIALLDPERTYGENISARNPVLKIFILAASVAAAFLLCFDYGGTGILLIVYFYTIKPFYQIRQKKDKWIQAGKVTVITGLLYGFTFGLSQLYALFALPLIYMYNGKKGKQGWKYAFYLFYPLHLLAIWGIHNFLLT